MPRASSLQQMMTNRRVMLALTALTALLVSAAAFYLRMMPMSNYRHVEVLAEKYGIPASYAKYAYLNANDPWIEYWLANYLHQHGIGSWTTLTRSNPATHIFWYPWGRDFTKTEYPLVPIMGSLGKNPLISTVMLPALAGAAMVLTAYAFAALLYGPLAGIVAALLAAFVPAAASRTFAGFVEKTGIAMPFVMLALLFYTLAVEEAGRKTRAIVYSAAAALFWLLTELTWGGYALLHLAVTLTVLLAPLSLGLRSEKTRHVILVTLVTFLLFTVPAYLLQAIGYGKVSLSFTAVTTLAIAFVYLAVYMLATKPGEFIPAKYLAKPERLYAYIVILLFTAGPLAAYMLHLVTGKYAYTILWPLRDLGVIHVGRIGETVAEMSGVISRGGFRDFFYETNVVGLLAPAAALYLLYRSLRRNEAKHLPIAALSLLLFYSVLGMLYLLQAFSSISLLAVAALVELAVQGAWRQQPRTSARRRQVRHHGGEAEDLAKLVSLILVGIVLIGTVFAAADTRSNFSVMAATVTGGSVNRVYLSWLWLLHHLDSATPNDTVVAAWWDYGYWISVGSGRPTLADGATMNGTQIRLLATAFTGSENEANTVFSKLHLRPGKTLVLFNDYIVYNPKKGTVSYLFPQTGIDLMKSWAMHHIAGRDSKFNNMLALILSLLQGTGNRAEEAAALRSYINNTLIFKLMIDAGYYMQTHAVVVPSQFKPLLGKLAVKGVYLAGTKIPLMRLEHFKPYLVIVAPFMDARGRPIVNPDGSILAHVIALYTWDG